MTGPHDVLPADSPTSFAGLLHVVAPSIARRRVSRTARWFTQAAVGERAVGTEIVPTSCRALGTGKTRADLVRGSDPTSITARRPRSKSRRRPPVEAPAAWLKEINRPWSGGPGPPRRIFIAGYRGPVCGR